MTSFEYDIGEKERAGSRFVSDVNEEMQRALSIEKSKRKITFQAIAEKLGLKNRSVVNRQFMGLENLTARSIGELLWAIGWEPHFEARKVDVAEGENEQTEPKAKFRFETPEIDADHKTTKTSATGKAAELETV